jgi:serine/threonine protein kinase
MAHGDLNGVSWSAHSCLTNQWLLLIPNRPLQSNIFITDDSHACLADFGLTVIGDLALAKVPTTLEVAGATRWLAPELLVPDKTASASRKTPAGDMLAFGRLCLAVSDV